MGVGGVGAGSVLIMNEFYVSIFSVVGDGVLHVMHPFHPIPSLIHLPVNLISSNMHIINDTKDKIKSFTFKHFRNAFPVWTKCAEKLF